jgi:hypothetical protein
MILNMSFESEFGFARFEFEVGAITLTGNLVAKSW